MLPQVKRAQARLQSALRGMSLAMRFLMVAALTVTMASLLMAVLVTRFLEAGILDGVARTASASIETAIYPTIRDLSFEHNLTANERLRLDEVFALGREADSTRLLQFELRRPDGSRVYSADGGLIDDVDPDLIARAADGTPSASLRNVGLSAIGPFAPYTFAVIRIVTPLMRPGERTPFVIATMYFSARALLDIEDRVRTYVWTTVALIGIGVILALFATVGRTSRLIVGQQSQLARSAAEWRRLAGENNRLHLASEQLRLDANSANESLLVRVGSDIHDGPVQVLALLILKLSGAKIPKREYEEFVEHAQGVMEELRNISAGLVLPELSALSLADTLDLAVSRHERATGGAVATSILQFPETASMAVKTCAYRVVQEGLNNAHRHGGKGSQRVDASIVEDRLELCISNPAKHQPVSNISVPVDRIGLIGMRLRVEALGGHLAVEHGEMTFLRVSIPMTSPVLPQTSKR